MHGLFESLHYDGQQVGGSGLDDDGGGKSPAHGQANELSQFGCQFLRPGIRSVQV